MAPTIEIQPIIQFSICFEKTQKELINQFLSDLKQHVDFERIGESMVNDKITWIFQAHSSAPSQTTLENAGCRIRLLLNVCEATNQ